MRPRSRCPTFLTGMSTRGSAYEKEILGFFVTGHPLEKYSEKLLDFHALTTTQICELKASTGKGEVIDRRRAEGNSRCRSPRRETCTRKDRSRT